jgi:uncharacterized protein
MRSRAVARTGEKAVAKATPAIGGKVLVDSGPLQALFNVGDSWHARVLKWLRQNEQALLVSTWPVTEVCALLSRRVGNPAALDFLRWVQRGGVAVDEPAAHTLTDVLTISERFADLPLDLADAAIAEAAARLRTRQVLTIDADFDIYRDKAGKPLTNVLRSAT